MKVRVPRKVLCKKSAVAPAGLSPGSVVLQILREDKAGATAWRLRLAQNKQSWSYDRFEVNLDNTWLLNRYPIDLVYCLKYYYIMSRVYYIVLNGIGAIV